MLTIVLWPVLVMVLGALVWAFAPDRMPKVQEAGKLMFFVGLFVVVWRAPSGGDLFR